MLRTEPIRRGVQELFENRWKGRRTFDHWRQLERSQWWPKERVEQLQFDRLQALLRHASLRSPYYRQRLAERGLDVAEIQSLRDFQKWPTLDRQAVTRNGSELLTCDANTLQRKATGGSTGQPLSFYIDAESYERRWAATFRGYNWACAGPGTRQFYFWGVPLEESGALGRLKNRIWEHLQHRRTESCFGFDQQRVQSVAKRLARYRPEVIVGYVSALDSLAKYLEAEGIKPYRPRSIVVGAEKLYREQREQIERVFDAPVFETYGNREFMLIGAECSRHNGLHISNENLVVEVLDDAGFPARKGDVGEVVITDLTNYGQPMIRYRTGDMATAGFETCSCGRALPLLREIRGRELDIIRSPAGRMLPGEYFPHLLKDYIGVHRFQVRQVDSASVEVQIEPNQQWTSEQGSSIRRKLENELPGMCVRLKCDELIPCTAAGKHRVVIGLGASAPVADMASV